MRVDDGGYRVGRVVKPVDEFESERHEEREHEQHVRERAGGADLAQIGDEVARDIEHSEAEEHTEHHAPAPDAGRRSQIDNRSRAYFIHTEGVEASFACGAVVKFADVTSLLHACEGGTAAAPARFNAEVARPIRFTARSRSTYRKTRRAAPDRQRCC